MRSSINLTILFLIGIALYLPSEYCQELWKIIPAASENQEDLAGDILGEPIGFQPQPGMDNLPQSGQDVWEVIPEGSENQEDLGGGALGKPIGFQPQSGKEILPPPAMAPPHIEFFSGPSEAKPGDKVTLTWKVLYASCGCFLDTNPVPTTGSFTYTVPSQGAPDIIYHQLLAYGEPCNDPVPKPVARELTIQVQQARAPDAPTNLEFLGWGSGPESWQPILRWLDNSNDELGFQIFDTNDMWIGSVGPNVATWSIPKTSLLASSFEFKVRAHNNFGPSDFTNSVKVEMPIELDLRNNPFFLDSSRASDEYYINIYRPGPIVAIATWTGTTKDLDLAIDGPGNYGLHARGGSPISLAYRVTSDDLINGSTWKISIINYDKEESAQGTLDLTFPKGCSWAGTWDTSFGKMKLKCHQNEFGVSGTYDRDQGSVRGLTTIPYGPYLVGIWKEYPTYGPPNDAGDLVLWMTEDCKSFTGNWRYGNRGNLINRTVSLETERLPEKIAGSRRLTEKIAGSGIFG
jgi:hypothetical protein